MSISNAEMAQIYQAVGGGKMPMTGGPAGSLKSCISQTMPFEMASSTGGSLGNGTMNLTAIFISQGKTISNINYVTAAAAISPTRTWFALYDDGRGSTTAGQLALLGQTADQGSGAIGANISFGLSLILPWTTQYTGTYFVAFCQTAGTLSTVAAAFRASTALGVSTPSSLVTIYGGTAGSGLTNQAPNPSGTVTSRQGFDYAYVS